MTKWWFNFGLNGACSNFGPASTITATSELDRNSVDYRRNRGAARFQNLKTVFDILGLRNFWKIQVKFRANFVSKIVEFLRLSICTPTHAPPPPSCRAHNFAPSVFRKIKLWEQLIVGGRRTTRQKRTQAYFSMRGAWAPPEFGAFERP